MKTFSFQKGIFLFVASLLLFIPQILYSSEIFSVQVGAFSSKNNALNLVENLKEGGVKCISYETTGLYKVYCGEFSRESDVYALRGKLSSIGYDSSFIIRTESTIRKSSQREVALLKKEKTDEKSHVPVYREISNPGEKKDIQVDREVAMNLAERKKTEDIKAAQWKGTTLSDKDPPSPERGRWIIQLEPMWMYIKGNDVHVGDIFRYKEVLDGTALRYGTTYEPIKPDMKDKITLRTEIIYMIDRWGLGIDGWWFNTENSQKGSVTTPSEEITSTGSIDYIHGVRMWDNTIEPAYNDLQPISYFDGFDFWRFSPVSYWTKNELGVWTIDIFGARTLAEKNDSHINMAFGLKLGSLSNDREEGQEQRGFEYDYFGAGLHLDNNITLKSASKADYGLMAGPVVGLQGKMRYKSLGIEGLLNQSLLIGRVRHSGTFTDIDDMWIVTGPVGGPFTPVSQDSYLEGKFKFSKNETVTVPITELKLKFLYDLDIPEKGSIGIGAFASIWWNAPVAPKWSIPGAWTWDEGTGWRLQEHTLTFYGVMAAINIEF